MKIIDVTDVTKEFRLGQLNTFRRSLTNAWARARGQVPASRPIFKALKGVSFTVDQGDVLGIIGHNGAGKSTLLKLLAGITRPSSGSLSVKGRVAPLIEVGAGLVSDMTGRENIFLNAAILGISRKEIRRKFDDIVSFAELEEFVDTPIKRYSSGMQVRLGFAIATAVESEILIVDEVLAVGDLAFQRKCFDRLDGILKGGKRTVIVVSHNLRQIERLCKRVLMLDHGTLVADGPAREICNKFYEASDKKIGLEAAKSRSRPHRSSGAIELKAATLLSKRGEPTNCISLGEGWTLKVNYLVRDRLDAPIFGVGIHTTDFINLATEQSVGRLDVGPLDPGEYVLRFHVSNVGLLPGFYSFRLGVADGRSGGALFFADGVSQFRVQAAASNRAWVSEPGEGFFALNAEWSIEAVSEGHQCTA